MEVTVVNVNRGFAVIDMNEKDYGWIELLDSNCFEEGDILEGNFNLGEERIYNHTQKINMDIFLEDWGCRYEDALNRIMK